MNWPLLHAGTTNKGRVRTKNEDQWFADPDRGLYIIADGMGATSHGGLAAKLVIETLPQLIAQRLDGLSNETPERISAEVKQCIADLSRRLHSESHGSPGLEGMGSTVVLALLRPLVAVVAHLGDSRAYLLKGGQLRRCTTDHTLVELLIESGEISHSQSMHHPARGQLTRFVGMPGEALADVHVFDLHQGDQLLLCSDGLTSEIDDAVIEEILCRSSGTLEERCRQLVDQANDSGGRDNITAILIERNTQHRSHEHRLSSPAPDRSARPHLLRTRNKPSS